MVTLKSEREINRMLEAGKLLASCHKEIAEIIEPGITTWEIDHFVEEYLRKHGAVPEQKGTKVIRLRHAPPLTMKYATVFHGNPL